jgi:hypothetical protein
MIREVKRTLVIQVMALVGLCGKAYAFASGEINIL